MAITLQGTRIVLRDGTHVGTGQECCCPSECRQIEASSGGEGVTIDTYEFPPEELELLFTYDAYVVPDKFIVRFCGSEVYNTGFVPADGEGSGDEKSRTGFGFKCLTKPEGCTEVEIEVQGTQGTAWVYTIKCGCPPPPPPYPCCKKIGECEGTEFYDCSGECTQEDPGQVCDPDLDYVMSMPDRKPWNCFGRTHLNYLFGATIEISGWDIYKQIGVDRADFEPWNQALLDYVQELMNGEYFAPWDSCYASIGDKYLVEPIYEFDGPTITILEDTYSTRFGVFILLDMCTRTGQVTILELNYGFASATTWTALGPVNGQLLTPRSGCSYIQGCYCTAWTETMQSGTGDNGTFTVR